MGARIRCWPVDNDKTRHLTDSIDDTQTGETYPFGFVS